MTSSPGQLPKVAEYTEAEIAAVRNYCDRSCGGLPHVAQCWFPECGDAICGPDIEAGLRELSAAQAAPLNPEPTP